MDVMHEDTVLDCAESIIIDIARVVFKTGECEAEIETWVGPRPVPGTPARMWCDASESSRYFTCLLTLSRIGPNLSLT